MVLSGTLGAQNASSMPAELEGTWRIQRIIPTRTITCWDERQARKLIGTLVRYTPAEFQWQTHSVSNPSVTSHVWTAEQFHDQYYGGPNDSQVDFLQLGIHSSTVTEFSIAHPAANITGGTVEIPGDSVLLKGPTQIVLSVCNVYFEAVRVREKSTSKRTLRYTGK